jgi:hypothetical protein
MLTKCANPGCTAKFHYFHEGKLFPYEIQNTDYRKLEFGIDPTIKKPSHRVEFFWLCQECSRKITLTYTHGLGITAMPMARAQSA